MPQILVFLDDDENKIVEKVSSENNISKMEAIKKIIKEKDN